MVGMVTTTVPATGNALGLDDLDNLPDDGRRYELVGGAIVMTAAPAPIHQIVSARLHPILQAATPEGHLALAAPIDLDLPGGQRVEPDLMVVPWASVGDKRLTTPVLLVVEIVSPGSTVHDRVTKRAVYAEAGIPPTGSSTSSPPRSPPSASPRTGGPTRPTARAAP
jgi:Uma2 family endonuclease